MCSQIIHEYVPLNRQKWSFVNACVYKHRYSLIYIHDFIACLEIKNIEEKKSDRMRSQSKLLNLKEYNTGINKIKIHKTPTM
jgi:hypothetical protein